MLVLLLLLVKYLLMTFDKLKYVWSFLKNEKYTVCI